MPKKTYVLDTSVILSNPRAIYSFGENEVVIPLIVIRELEEYRNDPELGRAARFALHALDDAFNGSESLESGIAINDEGGTLRIEVNHVDRSSLPEALKRSSSHDTRIIVVAHTLQLEQLDVVLVSKDLPMRILASAVGKIVSEDYHGDLVEDSGYTGLEKLSVSKEIIDTLYEDKSNRTDSLVKDLKGFDKHPINTGFVLKDEGSASALGIKTGKDKLRLVSNDIQAFGLTPRSAEQKVALSHLLDPEIGIVSLGGSAGTGKSVLALAAALEIVMEQRKAKKVIVFRPVFSVGGESLGYLPGTIEEKMEPFAQATKDAILSIATENVYDDIIGRGILEVMPLAYIRGRSFTDTIIIIDEAQNLERGTLLSALSRTGQGSRVFMTHDVAQRDNFRVGRYDGIGAVVEKLKDERLFSHTTLVRSERSPVAEMVTRLLELD